MFYKNRGMLLEKLINDTIHFLLIESKGVFHKKEIPVSFSKVTMQNNKKILSNAIIKNKSTTDYYGIYDGCFVAFEAKSTHSNVLPLANIAQHQHEYLKRIIFHKGIAFYIVGFLAFDEFFAINPECIENLNKKHLTLVEARKRGFRFSIKYPGILNIEDYLRIKK